VSKTSIYLLSVIRACEGCCIAFPSPSLSSDVNLALREASSSLLFEWWDLTA